MSCFNTIKGRSKPLSHCEGRGQCCATPWSTSWGGRGHHRATSRWCQGGGDSAAPCQSYIRGGGAVTMPRCGRARGGWSHRHIMPGLRRGEEDLPTRRVRVALERVGVMHHAAPQSRSGKEESHTLLGSHWKEVASPCCAEIALEVASYTLREVATHM